MSRRRLLLLSPCGWGNLGDAAILDSAIHAIRARRPDDVIVGVTLNPADTRRRHGIDAFPLRGASLDGYEVAAEEAPASDVEPAAVTPDRPSDDDAPSTLRRLVRGVPFARRGWRAIKDGKAERRHRERARELVRAGDTVVVAGGGQIDDFWGGPAGHPRTLAQWAAIAREADARLVVLSVGTGHLAAGSHADVRRLLDAADYVSFRDATSRTLAAQAADVARAPVVPDLAYAVPLPAFAPSAPSGPRVAVLPMVYRAPRAWPDADEAAYDLYLARNAALVARLVERGASVTLAGTGRSDERALDDLVPRVSDRRVARVPAPDVATLLHALRRANVVVAARLHGVLLGHVAGRPCVALAHERKVRTLMEDAQQDGDCFDIEGFDPHAVAARALAAVEAGDALADRIAADAARRRAQVDAQYDAVFGARP